MASNQDLCRPPVPDDGLYYFTNPKSEFYGTPPIPYSILALYRPQFPQLSFLPYHNRMMDKALNSPASVPYAHPFPPPSSTINAAEPLPKIQEIFPSVATVSIASSAVAIHNNHSSDESRGSMTANPAAISNISLPRTVNPTPALGRNPYPFLYISSKISESDLKAIRPLYVMGSRPRRYNSDPGKQCTIKLCIREFKRYNVLRKERGQKPRVSKYLGNAEWEEQALRWSDKQQARLQAKDDIRKIIAHGREPMDPNEEL